MTNYPWYVITMKLIMDNPVSTIFNVLRMSGYGEIMKNYLQRQKLKKMNSCILDLDIC